MPSLSKYLKRFDPHSVLIVSNIKNSSDMADNEMLMSKELIQNNILFQHMVNPYG